MPGQSLADTCLVDCMSVVVREERGIRHLLADDHPFTQAGLVVVSQ